jgi:hypothetical protein
MGKALPGIPILTGQGAEDLLAMVRWIRPHDLESLAQEAKEMPAELLALAADPPAGLPSATVRALVKAAYVLDPDAAPAVSHFLEPGDDGDRLEEFLADGLVGLACQLGVSARNQRTANRGELLETASRLMAAAAILSTVPEGGRLQVS